MKYIPGPDSVQGTQTEWMVRQRGRGSRITSFAVAVPKIEASFTINTDNAAHPLQTQVQQMYFVMFLQPLQFTYLCHVEKDKKKLNKDDNVLKVSKPEFIRNSSMSYW